MTAINADTIFLELADLDTEARQLRLRERCGLDESLRRDVEALLAQVFGDLPEVPTAFLDPHALRVADARAAADAILPPGMRLDEFTVLRVIGSGASGVVYVAQQDRPRRTVALKVLRSGVETSGLLRRFAREAELLGRLQHPGIAQVFKAQVDDPIVPPFIAMELVSGPPLTEHADARQLGVPERLLLIARVCDAVHHAHQRGVIHRDLKPANILVGEDGQPKVLDFGIARTVEEDPHLRTMQTMTGQVMGTLPYMSPEQIGGEPSEVDIRTDIYTLGVIVYRLLAGRLPFDLRGDSLVEAARRLADEDPPRLGTLDRHLRGDVEVIVARAMAKDKERRYQSAAQLAADLRHAASGEPIAALDDSAWYLLRQRLLRYRRAAVAAGCALVMVLGLAAYALRARNQADLANAQLTRELSVGTIERGRLSGLTNNLPLAEVLLWRELREGPNAEYARWALRELYLRHPSAWVTPPLPGVPRAVRLSPNGKLALTTGLDGAVRLWDAENGAARGVLSVKASPPQATFASASEIITGGELGLLQTWNVMTRTLIRGWIAHNAPVVALAAASDLGVAISAGQAGDLRAWRAASGSTLWAIEVTDAPEPHARIRAIAVEPVGSGRGQSIAVTWSTGHVDLRAIDTGHLIRRWRAHDDGVICAAFQPVPASSNATHAGRVLATGSSDRTVRVWDLESGALRSTLNPRNGSTRSIGFSPDGRLLAVSGWWRLEIWDAIHGVRIRGDIGEGDGWWDAQFAPSSGLLIASSVSGAGNVRAWELTPRAVQVDPVDVGEDRVTSFVSDDAARIWILTTSTGASAMSSPGSHTLTTAAATPRRPLVVAAASPDGQWLASAGEAPAVQLWRADASPETARAIDEPGRATALTFSKDGRWLAVGLRDGRVLLWDVAAGRVIWRAQSQTRGETLDLAFDPASSRLVSAHRPLGADVWRLTTGEHLQTLQTRSTTFSVAIDRAGRCALGQWEGAIELWNLDQGQRLSELEGHSRLVTALQFDDTTGRLFSASRDGTVRLWEVGTGHELAELTREAAGIEGLRVTADGSTLIVGTENGHIVRVALNQLDRYVERNASAWPR